MLVRIGVGTLQASVIAILPAAAMYLIASICGAPFSGFQNLFRLVLLLTGGAVFFAVALLVSSLVPGQYTPPVVALGILLLISGTLGDQKTRLFSPLAFMFRYRVLGSPIQPACRANPLDRSGARLCLAALLTWIAVRLIERREF
jgi:ABC-2 type transport system permease protein